VHHSIILEMTGDSYRSEAAKRRASGKESVERSAAKAT